MQPLQAVLVMVLPVVLVLVFQFARIVLPELLDSAPPTGRDRGAPLVGVRREAPIPGRPAAETATDRETPRREDDPESE